MSTLNGLRMPLEINLEEPELTRRRRQRKYQVFYQVLARLLIMFEGSYSSQKQKQRG